MILGINVIISLNNANQFIVLIEMYYAFFEGRNELNIRLPKVIDISMVQ
jgi:uncharacterized membrane protein (DUF373 family)